MIFRDGHKIKGGGLYFRPKVLKKISGFVKMIAPDKVGVFGNIRLISKKEGKIVEMKNVKRILCMLLVASVMFGIVLTNGGAIRAYADNADAPELPLKLDFEDETLDAFPSGWEVQYHTQQALPNAEKNLTIVDQGDGNKVLSLSNSPMPNNTNYHARYEFQPTDSILMKYRF